MDTWGFEIGSRKHYLVGKCTVMNGTQNKVERCRPVTVTKFNMQYANQSAHNVLHNVI